MEWKSDLVTFGITVCGIEELPDHAMRGVSHVLSILDPGAPVPPAFSTYPSHAKLELRFHDVIKDRPNEITPRESDVDLLLAFVLMVGGVVGAQFGASAGQRMRSEHLRALLAILVLGVCVRHRRTVCVRRARTRPSRRALSPGPRLRRRRRRWRRENSQ